MFLKNQQVIEKSKGKFKKILEINDNENTTQTYGIQKKWF